MNEDLQQQAEAKSLIERLSLMKLAAEQVLQHEQLQAWLEHLVLQAHSGQKWLAWKVESFAAQGQTFPLEPWAGVAKVWQQAQVSKLHWTQPQTGLSKPEALSLPEVPACPAAVFFVPNRFQSLSQLFLQVQENKLVQKMLPASLWQQACQQLEQFLLQQFAVWEKTQEEKEAFDFPQTQD